jgi:hypothetical protein
VIQSGKRIETQSTRGERRHICRRIESGDAAFLAAEHDSKIAGLDSAPRYPAAKSQLRRMFRKCLVCKAFSIVDCNVYMKFFVAHCGRR